MGNKEEMLLKTIAIIIMKGSPRRPLNPQQFLPLALTSSSSRSRREMSWKGRPKGIYQFGLVGRTGETMTRLPHQIPRRDTVTQLPPSLLCQTTCSSCSRPRPARVYSMAFSHFSCVSFCYSHFQSQEFFFFLLFIQERNQL